jgi:hypothetical protein
MARSTYIYVVVDEDDKPVRPFTVKRECQAYLDKLPGRIAALKVWRFHDYPGRPTLAGHVQSSAISFLEERLTP